MTEAGPQAGEAKPESKPVTEAGPQAGEAVGRARTGLRSSA